MKSFSGHLVEESKKGIQNKLVSAGMARHSKSERVGNPNKISDSDFTELIKRHSILIKLLNFHHLKGQIQVVHILHLCLIMMVFQII